MDNDEKMQGVVNGFYICSNDQHNQTNSEIFKRNIPDQVLEAQFSFRPVQTKYVKFPALNVRHTDNVSEIRTFYDTEETFNPGNSKGPYSGYIKNVDLENNLRNSYFALQKCNQSVYVPESVSDLYKETVNNNTKLEDLTHPGLFKTEDFKPFNADKEKKSYLIFNNSTRVQRNNIM